MYESTSMSLTQLLLEYLIEILTIMVDRMERAMGTLMYLCRNTTYLQIVLVLIMFIYINTYIHITPGKNYGISTLQGCSHRQLFFFLTLFSSKYEGHSKSSKPHSGKRA